MIEIGLINCKERNWKKITKSFSQFSSQMRLLWQPGLICNCCHGNLKEKNQKEKKDIFCRQMALKIGRA